MFKIAIKDIVGSFSKLTVVGPGYYSGVKQLTLDRFYVFWSLYGGR